MIVVIVVIVPVVATTTAVVDHVMLPPLLLLMMLLLRMLLLRLLPSTAVSVPPRAMPPKLRRFSLRLFVDFVVIPTLTMVILRRGGDDAAAAPASAASSFALQIDRDLQRHSIPRVFPLSRAASRAIRVNAGGVGVLLPEGGYAEKKIVLCECTGALCT